MTTTQWRYREDPGYAPYTWRTTPPEDEDVVGDIEYRATPEDCNCLAEQQDFCECPSD